MLNQKISKYLEYALKVELYLILLSPLLVSSKYLFPFITTKTIYFRILVEIAIFLYAALAMMLPKFRPKMTKLSWAVVVFGIIIFLTALTGVNFYKSFWGTIERGEGFLTISHLIIYFLILTWVFKTKKEWINYLTGTVVIGFLVNGYALLQKLNVEKFLFWPIIHSGEGRLSATIGNAAFLGAYVLQIFFFSLLLFFERKKLAWKIFFGISIALSLFILFYTQTRGALLSLIFGMVFLTFLFIFNKSEKMRQRNFKVTKRILIGLSLILLVAIIFVYINRNSDWVRQQSTLNRLANISRSDITTQSRFFAWDTSFKGWKDRFLLGYGWENYNVAFNKYFHPEIFIDQGSQVWFDRAHNTPFDIAVASGLFGIISYLAIFVIALRVLWKNKADNFYLNRILIVALVCHFLQNIFVFDVLATYLSMFMIFALISYLDKKNDVWQEQDTRVKNINFLSIVILFLIIIFSVYFFNLRPLEANKLSVEALLAASSGQEGEAVRFFKDAIGLGTFQSAEIRQKLADHVMGHNNKQYGLTDKQIAENYDLAISEMEKNIKDSPLDVQHHLYLMTLLNRGGSLKPVRYDQVIDWGEKALKLSSTRAHIYFEMGQARIAQKRFEQGIAYLKKAVELNPHTSEAHWNLMSAYLIAGQDDNFQKEYDYLKTVGFNFNLPQNLERIYRVYLIAGRKDKMANVLEQIAVLSSSGQTYARLAALYKEMGEIEKAKAAVKKAVELDPNLAEQAEKFLDTLK